MTDTGRQRRRRTTMSTAAAAASLLTASLLASACGTDSSTSNDKRPASTSTSERATTTRATTTTTADIAAGRPYRADQQSFVDHRTAADGSVRELRAELWLPDRPGPAPLVAFAHGMGGNPNKFHQLFQALAAAGYAVVAPRFPHSADDSGADLATAVKDVDEQALDLTFVVDRVRARSKDAKDALAGRIDRSRLALAGLSLGGGTVLKAAYTDCCASLKPSIAIAYSPVPFATTAGPDAVPLWLVHGTDDRTLPYNGSRDLYSGLHNRRWFVTLQGAPHSAPYEDSVSAFDQLVPTFTIDVLDQFVLGDTGGIDRAIAAISASGDAAVEATAAG